MSNVIKFVLAVLVVVAGAFHTPEPTLAGSGAETPGGLARDSDISSRGEDGGAIEALAAMSQMPGGSVASSLSASPDDAAIVILNPKSVPVVGGSWDVNFLAKGRGDLRVSAVAPTVMHDIGRDHADVMFRWVEIGGERHAFERVGDSFVVKDVSIDGLGTVSVRVLTPDRHRLRIDFGASYGIADNTALATFSAVAIATVGLNNNAGNAMVFADFNGDGYPDFAKTSTGGAAGDLVRVGLNDQDGTFTMSTGITTLSYRGIGAGDWDHDGDMDIVSTVNTASLIPRVSSNNGTATAWATTNPASTNCEAVVFLDINGDGYLDIWSPGEFQMWHRSNAGASFTAQNAVPGTTVVLSNGEGSTAADFTNDGRFDLIYNTGSGGGSVCHAYVPNAAWSYTRTTNVNTAFGLPQDVGEHEDMDWAWGDFDNDGDVDVFVSGSAGVGLYRNNGAGVFTNVSAALGVTITATTKGAAWGDIDNDGDIDLIVAKDANTILYRNNGAPTYNFTAITAIAGIPNVNSNVGFCDFDLDGDLDIMSLQGQYYRNNLEGTAKTDYLRVRAVGAGGAGNSPITPIGARIRVYDSTGTTLLATRWVEASQNSFQPYQIVHFGLDRGLAYVVKVLFPSSQKEITVTEVSPPAVTTTIGATTLQQTLTVNEASAVTYSAADFYTPFNVKILYGQNAASNLMERDFSTTTQSLSAASTIAATGREVRWITMERAANGHLIALTSEFAGGGTGAYFVCRRFNGTTWTTDWQNGPHISWKSQVRTGELARMTASGEILMVHGTNSQNPVYRVYANGVWTADADVFATPPGADPLINTVETMRLVTHPTTDEVWLVFQDSDAQLIAVRWNGTSWDEAATEVVLATGLKTNNSTGYLELRNFDACFESVSGDLLVAWGPGGGGATTVQWRVKAAASDTFGGASSLAIHSAGANSRRANTVIMKANPTSDFIALMTQTTRQTEAQGAAMWNGTAWQDATQIKTVVNNEDGTNARYREMMALDWVGNVAVGVYQDTNNAVINWCRWTSGGGWTNEADQAFAGVGALESTLAFRHEDSGVLGFLISDDSNDLWLATYNGTAWTTYSPAMELNLSTQDDGCPFYAFPVILREGNGLWTGAISSDWSDPRNWDNHRLPTGGAVTIPTGTPNQPIILGAQPAVTTIRVATGATLTIAAGGSITASGNITLNGTLQVDSGSTLTMGNATTINVLSGGSLLARGSEGTDPTGAAAFTTATPATQAFTIVAASGALVDLKGASVTAGRIIINDGAGLRLSSVAFSTLPAATTHFVDLTAVTAGTFNFRQLSFERGNLVTAALARNIAVAPTTPPVAVYGYSGDLAGESFDSDSTNSLLWQNNCFALRISGTTYWQYRRPIRIDHTKVGRGGVTNFPVHISVTDPGMIGKVQANGNDFRFRDIDGVKLDHEIEYWDNTTGALSCWVRIPDLSDRVDTRLWLEYGNPLAGDQRNTAGVWDANHLAVWHLGDASSGTAVDSTSNGRNGAAFLLNEATGPFGRASNWTASTAGNFRRVQLSVGGYFPTTTCSYEIWVRSTSAANDAAIVSYTSTARDNDFLFFNQKNLSPYVRSTNTTTGININNSQWRHLAMTWTNSDGYCRIYVDGVAVYGNSFNAGLALGPTGGLVLGQEQDSVLGGYATNQAMIGDMAEFRWSNIVRTEPWIRTQYNMGVNTAAFAIVSPEESVSPNILDISEYLPDVGETLTVVGATVDSSNRVVNSHADHRGVFVLPAFLGTLNIEGVRFSPPSTATGVSVALGATGTVNFYNCAFIDSGNGMTTAAAGAGRALITSAGATRTATFCTIDSSNAATAGFTSATSCLFTANLSTGGGGTRATYVMDFNNRDLRPTHAMLIDGAFGAARHGTFTKDLDGRERSATTRIGAWEHRSSSAMTVANSDISNGLGTGTLVNFSAPPANNTAGNAIYLSGSDGATVYLSVLNRTTLAVQYVASWAGALAGMPVFTQTSDQASQYWIYVPYDSDGNGSFDRVRRLKHTVATSLTNSGDQTMLNASGGAIDLTSNGGWNGLMSLQNSFTTGVTSGEIQVSIASPAGNGQIHSWYLNRLSTSGTFWNTAAFTGIEHRASDSYSGSAPFRFSPNEYAQPLASGSPSSGYILLTRRVDATNNTSLVRLNRNLSGTVTVLNSYTAGTAIGDSITGTPFSLFATGSKVSVQRSDQAGTLLLQWPTLAAETITITSPSGMVGAMGVPPVAFSPLAVNFIPLAKSSASCFGGVAAVEYTSTQDGGGTFDLLDASYAGFANKLQYDDDTGTPGSFIGGVAQTVGSPTRLAYAPTPATNTVLFAGTDAGLLYCWEAHGIISTSNTQRKGQLISGFPIRIEAGRITAINFVTISDTTLRARINLPAGSGNVLAVFTDRGQVVLVRTPEVP